LRSLKHLFLVLVFCRCFALAAQAAPSAPIHVEVDATDAPRNIFRTRLTIAAPPGGLTLVYPKWIPGNHRPSGPITNLTGLKIQVNGQDIPWQRDPIDMYAFHVNVPQGAREVSVSLDTLTGNDSAGGGGAAASSQVLDLNWNQVVLYPTGVNSDDVRVAPRVRLPKGWNFGTALTTNNQSQDWVEFEPVSLTTLVDSPLIAGGHYRKIELGPPGLTPVHVIDMVGETDLSLQMTSPDQTAYENLVAETGELFKARHYRQYHFLYTLSDQVGHHGLEHHESSDNSVGERALTNSEERLLEAGLLPHEFVHSWNGKYRRPAGLATHNYQEPMIGDLLWVYEGLTEYLGNVLTARSGLWTREQYRDALAETAAAMDFTAGRQWRPLEDTAISVQILRMAEPEWQSWRRSLDYYPESELIWLEVDTRIRQLSESRRSLDDFCRSFHGGQSGTPAVVPYRFEDVVKALNDVAPYDWGGLLKKRVNSITTHAPTEGIEAGGWRLVYNDTPNPFTKAVEKISKTANFGFSLGFWVRQSGELGDVVPGSPAYQAGLGPGMKLVAVNGRKWSPEVLRDAILAGKNNDSRLELIAENRQFFKTYSIAYHGGEKYPHLERNANQPDLLDDILQPLAKK